jgi:hypothetical protein
MYLTEENRALLFALVPKQHQQELEKILFQEEPQLSEKRPPVRHKKDSSDYSAYLPPSIRQSTAGSGDWSFIIPSASVVKEEPVAGAAPAAQEETLVGTETDGVEAKPKHSRRQSIDPQEAVQEAWEIVHAELMAEAPLSARIDRGHFMAFCTNELLPKGSKQTEDYKKYVSMLFDTATSLMLPKPKNDLGKHCFGYAALLAGEFYFSNMPADRLGLKSSERPNDSVAHARADLDKDWDMVVKDESGRVALSQFRDHFKKKHEGKLIPETEKHYEAFLDSNFQSALAMMLPEKKSTLGGHSFRYAGLLAGEFFFGAAKDAETSCGCSEPVADVLQIATLGESPAVEDKNQRKDLDSHSRKESSEGFFDDDASSDGEHHTSDGRHSEHVDDEGRQSEVSANASFFSDHDDDLSRALDLAGSGLRKSSNDMDVDGDEQVKKDANIGPDVHLSILAAMKEGEDNTDDGGEDSGEDDPEEEIAHSKAMSTGSESERAYARRSSVSAQDLREIGVDLQSLGIDDVVAPVAIDSAGPQKTRRLSAHEMAELEALSPLKLQDYLVSECGVEANFLQDEVPTDSQELVAFAQTMEYDLRPVLGLIVRAETTSPSPTAPSPRSRKKSLPHNPLNAKKSAAKAKRSPQKPAPKAVIMGNNWDMDSGYDQTEWQKALERNKSGIIMKKQKSGILKQDVGHNDSLIFSGDDLVLSNFGDQGSQIPRDRGFMESFVYKGDGKGNSISSVFGHIPKDDDDSSEGGFSDNDRDSDTDQDSGIGDTPVLDSAPVANATPASEINGILLNKHSRSNSRERRGTRYSIAAPVDALDTGFMEGWVEDDEEGIEGGGHQKSSSAVRFAEDLQRARRESQDEKEFQDKQAVKEKAKREKEFARIEQERQEAKEAEERAEKEREGIEAGKRYEAERMRKAEQDRLELERVEKEKAAKIEKERCEGEAERKALQQRLDKVEQDREEREQAGREAGMRYEAERVAKKAEQRLELERQEKETREKKEAEARVQQQEHKKEQKRQQLEREKEAQEQAERAEQERIETEAEAQREQKRLQQVVVVFTCLHLNIGVRVYYLQHLSFFISHVKPIAWSTYDLAAMPSV